MRSILAGSIRRPALAIAILALVALLSGLRATVALADSGYATWYGPGFQGNEMYYGGTFDMYDPTTAACNILPAGTWVKVTNPSSGRSVIVQVRDRGNFSYAFDLSYAAFKAIADPDIMGIPIVYHVVAGPNGDPTPTPTPAPAPAKAVPSSSSAPPGQYVVQPGDTINSIATQFGVDPRDLAAWNGIANPDLLPVGTTLRLTPPPKAAPSTPTPVPASTATYVVQPGDTLNSIARTLGVSPDQLIALNNLADPDHLVEGQALVVPAPRPSTRTYIVQPGDTLNGIADSFGVSSSSIASANHLSNPDDLQPGTKLVIPSS